VVIALLSLAAATIPLVTTLGYTAATVVLVAVLAAITLLPAILSLIGPSIDRLRVPGMRPHHDERPHGWAAFVGSHPWPALLVGIVVLVILALPVRYLFLGQTDNGALPKSTESPQSYDTMTEGFGAGSNGPMLVAVNLSKPAHNDQADLENSGIRSRNPRSRRSPNSRPRRTSKYSNKPKRRRSRRSRRSSRKPTSRSERRNRRSGNRPSKPARAWGSGDRRP
jgi:putative drug exporter of the RND superfamily